MKKTESFDLGSIDTIAACNKGTEFELRHPATNAHIGIFWTLVGRDSDVFRSYVKEQTNAAIRREAMAKKRGKDPDIKTVEDYEQDTITLLTICSVGWRSSESNTIKFKGEELVFNVPNVKRVLTDMPWIRNQLNEFISELENFMTC